LSIPSKLTKTTGHIIYASSSFRLNAVIDDVQGDHFIGTQCAYILSVAAIRNTGVILSICQTVVLPILASYLLHKAKVQSYYCYFHRSYAFAVVYNVCSVFCGSVC